jgi:two-component system, OmpR family, phosphate regulon sensor histidine kinase PhoR
MTEDQLQEEMKVLVVDDEKSIRDGSQRILERMGFGVFTAKNGEEGLEVLDRQDIAIVLLDLKMPGIDGMEVLRRIRETKSPILVIVITGFATLETAIEAMKRGAYDFIPKPFEPDQLRIVVNRARETIRLTIEAQKAEEERQRTLSDLGTEKSRIRTIIESLPNALLVTNAHGQAVLMNPAFKKMFGIGQDSPTNNPIGFYISDEELCRLVMDISRGRYIDFEDIPTYEFSLGPDKYLLARSQPVLGDRKECLGAVVTFLDITAMKVLDRLKSEFVAKVSHELRSPLSTIHEQIAQVIRDTAEEETEKDQHILSRAKEKTQGLISLIGDLLDLSRIESGSANMEPKAIKLDELLKSVVEFMEVRAKSKNQELGLNLPEKKLPELNMDPMALESIFGNLITNALNYTPEGGRVLVNVEYDAGPIRIHVIDNGFGIEAKYLDKIFDKFYRVKNEKTRFITGTGLGLPIVKGLVDSLGGTITVESAPGEGSKFTVILPIPIKQNQPTPI